MSLRRPLAVLLASALVVTGGVEAGAALAKSHSKSTTKSAATKKSSTKKAATKKSSSTKKSSAKTGAKAVTKSAKFTG